MTKQTWYPDGTRTTWERPAIGSLVATRRAVFRIVDYIEYPIDQWTSDDHDRVRFHGPHTAPYHVILRPAHITSDDVRARDHDQSYTIRSARLRWLVYPDEHYPLCGTCGDPMPCREKTAARETSEEMRRMARYETPGVCPACQETITTRQKFRTFAENVIVPLGPPVTFHARARCRDGLLAYEDKWVEADPTNRTSSRPPVCPGTAIIHVGTGLYDCTTGTSCPGARIPEVGHNSMRACDCPEHPGGFSRGDGMRHAEFAAPDARTLDATREHPQEQGGEAA